MFGQRKGLLGIVNHVKVAPENIKYYQKKEKKTRRKAENNPNVPSEVIEFELLPTVKEQIPIQDTGAKRHWSRLTSI